MDFTFNINELFKDEITVVDNVLEFCRKKGVLNLEIGRERFQQQQNKVYEIVDKMGEASAKTQGLHSAITTGKKLALSDHRLYVMKDSNGNCGRGSIVGLLKVGTKKLFIYDSTKMQHEIQPLCVLDFYVHESMQRMGCGRKLFDFMLEREQIFPQHLAIDRPSSKYLSFMAKHYNLHVLIPQVNNFVVFEGFFSNRSDFGNNQNRRPVNTPHDDHNNWVKQPMSDSGWRNYNSLQLNKNTDKIVHSKWIMQNNLRQLENSHMGASQRMYSRHGTIAGAYCHERPVSSRNCHLQDSWSAHSRATHKPSVAAAEQKCSNCSEFMSDKQSIAGNRDSASTPSFGGHSRNGVSSPVLINVNYLPHTMQAAPSFQLSEISTSHQIIQKPPSALSFGVSHQPHSRAPDNKTGLKPILQQQEHHLTYNKDMFNISQKHQQRNEQHSISTMTSAMIDSNTCSSQSKSPITFAGNGNSQPSNNSSWTVTGVLLDQQLKAAISRAHTSSNHNLWDNKFSL